MGQMLVGIIEVCLQFQSQSNIVSPCNLYSSNCIPHQRPMAVQSYYSFFLLNIEITHFGAFR